MPSPLPRGRHGLPPGYVRRHQRARILDAVLEVSATHGFEAASVRELIVVAGLSTEAFYSHFPSKEDAWATVFDQAFVELFAAVWHAALAESGRTAKVTAAVDAGARPPGRRAPSRRGCCSSTRRRPAVPACRRSTMR